MTCDKCGKEMTPTVLLTSTVYDCVDCRPAPTPKAKQAGLDSGLAIAYQALPEHARRVIQQQNEANAASQMHRMLGWRVKV